MIVVVQRVATASVEVAGRAVASIDAGLLALVGVVDGDARPDVEAMANRIRNIRVFADSEGRMNRSVADVEGAVLLVPNFTLAADTRRGRRPSFGRAAAPAAAKRLFEDLADTLRATQTPVATGAFGAHMAVELVNDGPVTLILDTREKGGEVPGTAVGSPP